MVFDIIRINSAKALKDPLVKKILGNYVKIVNDKIPANFLICDSINVKFDETLTKEELLRIHESAMRKFYELKESFLRGKRKIERKEKSLLDLKIALARKILERCELCEWKCKVNRRDGKLGVCKVGNKLLISSEFVHVGEESYFVPSHTIFFWSCNMYCVFCQNYTISYRLEKPFELSPKILASVIDIRRKEGCINVNFVGGEPTPYLPFILETLKNVKVNVPVIWNSNMYMSELSMKILDGIVDVYLADFKFGPGNCSKKYTKVKNYWKVVTRNLKLASKHAEIVIRHLILPNHVKCCTKPILEWIANNLKEKALVNLMDQYRPYFDAFKFKEISRRIDVEEWKKAMEIGEKLGINIKG